MVVEALGEVGPQGLVYLRGPCPHIVELVLPEVIVVLPDPLVVEDRPHCRLWKVQHIIKPIAQEKKQVGNGPVLYISGYADGVSAGREEAVVGPRLLVQHQLRDGHIFVHVNVGGFARRHYVLLKHMSAHAADILGIHLIPGVHVFELALMGFVIQRQIVQIQEVVIHQEAEAFLVLA